MAERLKNQNNHKIYSYILGAILLSTAAHIGFKKVFALVELMSTVTAVLCMPTVALLLVNLLPSGFKCKLLFTRIKDEMPGSRAHKICKNDPRINMEHVSAIWPDLFSSTATGRDRNQVWYQDVYKPVQNTPQILDSHGSFLLYRDTFSGLFLLFCTSLVIYFFELELGNTGVIAFEAVMVLAAATALAMIAARNAGNRFVVNAIAAAS